MIKENDEHVQDHYELMETNKKLKNDIKKYKSHYNLNSNDSTKLKKKYINVDDDTSIKLQKAVINDSDE
jgi:hypothetical protein